jgi:hypothetical protein
VTIQESIVPPISQDALAELAAARETEFTGELAELEQRTTERAALIHTGEGVVEDLAWQARVREAMAHLAGRTSDERLARHATPFAAVADFQLFARPWPFQRVNVSPGHVGTVDQQGGEAHVGLGLYFTTGWAAGAAEMGGPFRLPTFSDFEFRTTIDYSYDWYFSTAAGGADSKGYIEVFVDELLDAPGSTWHNILDRRYPLWEDDTGSGGHDGASDPGNRLTAQERFRGRPDASYVWWVGAHESIQTELQGASQANLYVDLSYIVVIARV